ncbi:unnamed protein product [Effrenium voratum]|nr:unnamed protein product [Effrenium voratum]CAJ1453666.1 unnamed protein product [Effrenium voratum]
MGAGCSEFSGEGPEDIVAVDTAEAVQPLLLNSEEDWSVSVKALREAFRQCDNNNDNFVTKIELIKACKQHPKVAELFGVPAHLRDDARAQFEHVFQAMDKDSDRRVSFEEVKAYFQRGGLQLQEDEQLMLEHSTT